MSRAERSEEGALGPLKGRQAGGGAWQQPRQRQLSERTRLGRAARRCRSTSALSLAMQRGWKSGCSSQPRVATCEGARGRGRAEQAGRGERGRHDCCDTSSPGSTSSKPSSPEQARLQRTPVQRLTSPQSFLKYCQARPATTSSARTYWPHARSVGSSAAHRRATMAPACSLISRRARSARSSSLARIFCCSRRGG